MAQQHHRRTFWLQAPTSTKRYPRYEHTDALGHVWRLHRTGSRLWWVVLLRGESVPKLCGGPWRGRSDAKHCGRTAVEVEQLQLGARTAPTPTPQ